MFQLLLRMLHAAWKPQLFATPAFFNLWLTACCVIFLFLKALCEWVCTTLRYWQIQPCHLSLCQWGCGRQETQNRQRTRGGRLAAPTLSGLSSTRPPAFGWFQIRKVTKTNKRHSRKNIPYICCINCTGCLGHLALHILHIRIKTGWHSHPSWFWENVTFYVHLFEHIKPKKALRCTWGGCDEIHTSCIKIPEEVLSVR